MALVASPMTYDGVVKSFEVSSVSFVSSGNSLHIKAETRMAKIKTLATLLLNWTVIPDTKRQQPVTSRLKSEHLFDTMSCQTPMLGYDVPRVVAVTENPCQLNRSMRHQLIRCSDNSSHSELTFRSCTQLNLNRTVFPFVLAGATECSCRSSS
jgi:hypothetical protein